MKARHYNNTYPMALAYAAADKSDPFTYNRIMAHIASGLCDDKDGHTDCRYKADAYEETRKLPPSPAYPDGQEYTITAYRNVQRP